MEKRKVSMSTFIIMIGIIVIGVLACYLVVLTQKEANANAKVEQLEKNIQEMQTQLQKVEEERNTLQDKVDSVANVIGKNNNQTSEGQNFDEENPNEGPGDMADYYVTIGKWKKFEFSTPVGEEGVFEIYAEKAVQATGFSGASAHIYYLREGILYYHNQGDTDTKLASGITDLKQQGEDIIAVKGNNVQIYIKNSYIQYK